MHESLGVIIFDSVRFLLKKSNQNRFKKKNRNRFKSIGFSFVRLFWGKNQFKLVWLSFFRFGSVFFGLTRFFFSVRFFWFQSYKIEPVGFLKILIDLIGFFLRFGFFSFFTHPYESPCVLSHVPYMLSRGIINRVRWQGSNKIIPGKLLTLSWVFHL